MRINEVITESLVDEAQMDDDIKKVMQKQGYKFLGHGQDQDAYLAPDGTILKIFGYETDSRGMSEGQRSFIDFANFCDIAGCGRYTQWIHSQLQHLYNLKSTVFTAAHRNYAIPVCSILVFSTRAMPWRTLLR